MSAAQLRTAGEPFDDVRLVALGGGSVRQHDPESVGSKAYNLMRLAEAGLPVPPGFVLPTSICREYHVQGNRLPADTGASLTRGVDEIERATGLSFGADRRPLLLAVRSGAAVSMPGMLETVLNVGLCDRSLPGLLRATGDPVFVWDSYRRLIQSYAEVVDGCPPAPFESVLADATRALAVPSVSELDVAALRDVVARFHDVYRSSTGHSLPQDPMEQLHGSVEAVVRSWNADRSVEYRRLEGLTELTGTTVTVQAMVFGNIGVSSGSGVGFTRDPASGTNQLYVDFLLDAQGEDVVAGNHRAMPDDSTITAVPGLAHELQSTRRVLERIFRDAQDFEFTVEEGRLWMLQSRTAKRTPWAALQIACDLVDEGLIDPATAIARLQGYDLDSITRRRLADGCAIEPIAHGVPAGIGVATGRLALSVDVARHFADVGDPVILVRHEASTEDIAGLAVCRGLLTATGARTSHATVVARQLGIVCIVGCADVAIDEELHRMQVRDNSVAEGASITIDGSSGAVYEGAYELEDERPEDLIARVRDWQARV